MIENQNNKIAELEKRIAILERITLKLIDKVRKQTKRLRNDSA